MSDCGYSDAPFRGRQWLLNVIWLVMPRDLIILLRCWTKLCVSGRDVKAGELLPCYCSSHSPNSSSHIKHKINNLTSNTVVPAFFQHSHSICVSLSYQLSFLLRSNKRSIWVFILNRKLRLLSSQRNANWDDNWNANGTKVKRKWNGNVERMLDPQ